jgi:transposase InsO family protein
MHAQACGTPQSIPITWKIARISSWDMDVAARLHGKAPRQSIVVLPERDPGFARQHDELQTGSVIQARISWVGDVLFHNHGVDGDARQTTLVDCARGAHRHVGFDQQPLGPFLADTLAPAGQRRGISRGTVLKERLPAEILAIRVLDPAGHNSLVQQLAMMHKQNDTPDLQDQKLAGL